MRERARWLLCAWSSKQLTLRRISTRKSTWWRVAANTMHCWSAGSTSSMIHSNAATFSCDRTVKKMFCWRATQTARSALLGWFISNASSLCQHTLSLSLMLCSTSRRIISGSCNPARANSASCLGMVAENSSVCTERWGRLVRYGSLQVVMQDTSGQHYLSVAGHALHDFL